MSANLYAVRFFLSLLPLTASAQLYWDGATPAGAPGGGSGTWNTTLVNWDSSPSGGDVAWPTGGSGAIFGGVGGSVVAGASFTQALGRPVSAMTFAVSGYTLNTSGSSVDVMSGIQSTLTGNVFNLSGTTGSLTVRGIGNLTAAQTITINSGRLALQLEPGNLPVGTASIALNGGALTIRRDGAPDSTLEEFIVPQSVTVGGNATISIDRITAAGGTGKRIVIPTATLGANTLTVTSLNSYTLALSQVTLTGNGVISTTPDMVIRSLSGGTNKLTKLGNGTLFIDGTTTLGGGLDIVTASVEARSSGALGVGAVSIGTNSTPGTGAASLGFDVAGIFGNPITISGSATGTRTLYSSAHGVVHTGAVAMSRSLVLSANDGADLALQGVVSGAFAVTKKGLGNTSLENPANTFGTGTATAITLNSGTLVTPTDAALGNTANGITFTGTTATNPAGLRFSENGATSRLLTFTNAFNRIEVRGEKTFALNTPTTGAGSFRKGGEGTLVFNVIPGHTGITAIESGELKTTTVGGTLGTLSLEGGQTTFEPSSATASSAAFTQASLSYDGASTLRLSNAGLVPDGTGNSLVTLASGGLARPGGGILYLSVETGLTALGTANGEKWTVAGMTTTELFSGSVIGLEGAIAHVLKYDSAKGVVSAAPSYVSDFAPLRTDEIVSNEGFDPLSISVAETVLALRSEYTDLFLGSTEIGAGNIVPATLTLGKTGESGLLISTYGGVIYGEGNLSTSNRELVVYVGQNTEPGTDLTSLTVESRIVATGGLVKCGPGVLGIGVPAIPHSIGEITVQEGELIIPDGTTVSSTYSVKIGGGTLTIGQGAFNRPIILSGSAEATLAGGWELAEISNRISGGASAPDAVGLNILGGVLLSNNTNTFTGNIAVGLAGGLVIYGQGTDDPTALGAGEKEILLNGEESCSFTVFSGDFNPPPNTKRIRVETIGAHFFIESPFTITLDDPHQLSGAGNLLSYGNLVVKDQADFTGNLDVLEGTFDLHGSIPANITVYSTMTFTSDGLGVQGPVFVFHSGLLTGVGTLANTLAIDGTISPGDAEIAEIRAQNIIQNVGAKTQLTLGTSSDRIAAIGNLTLAGELTITAGAGFGAGTYTIATYGGTLTGSLTLENPPSGFIYQVSTATPGEVRLIVSTVATFAMWQIANFGSTTLPAAQATADPDGDGQTNEVEFQAGTNPNSGTSIFATTVTKSSGGFALSWPSNPGRTYFVEAKDTLAAASWTLLASVPANSAPQTSYIDITVLASRFYQVRIAP